MLRLVLILVIIKALWEAYVGISITVIKYFKSSTGIQCKNSLYIHILVVGNKIITSIWYQKPSLDWRKPGIKLTVLIFCWQFHVIYSCFSLLLFRKFPSIIIPTDLVLLLNLLSGDMNSFVFSISYSAYFLLKMMKESKNV